LFYDHIAKVGVNLIFLYVVQAKLENCKKDTVQWTLDIVQWTVDCGQWDITLRSHLLFRLQDALNRSLPPLFGASFKSYRWPICIRTTSKLIRPNLMDKLTAIYSTLYSQPGQLL